MRNLELKILNMKIHIGGSRIVSLLLLLVFVVLWFRFAFFPFCKFNLIESDYGNATINETIMAYGGRIKTYGEVLFLTKGLLFENIPYKEGKVNIRLGWNNCITITSGNYEKVIHVDRICYYKIDNTNIIGKNGEFIILDCVPSNDSTYIGVGFADKNSNSITIYKQSGKLPYGGRKYGFNVDITGLKFVTGKSNVFNY